MARSRWKYLPLFTSDLKQYFNSLITGGKINILEKKAKETFNNWTADRKYKVYQGKTMVRLNVNEYFIGYKVGSFIKTRKPSFFRTKKK